MGPVALQVARLRQRVARLEEAYLLAEGALESIIRSTKEQAICETAGEALVGMRQVFVDTPSEKGE